MNDARPPQELLERYRAALQAYAAASASLEGLIGPEFDEAYQRAEDTRAKFEQARRELLNSRAKAEGA